MYDEQVRTNKSQGRTDWGRKAWCIIDIAVIDILNKNRKCCNHQCSDSVYFKTLLLIIYLSTTKTLVCRRDTSLIGSTSFGFAQNRYIIFKIPY